ncbi:MAG TPA: YHS domain-containing protein, partial [Acidimicrobiales bacterium]|nr:YHS domain-containing protein [Acidimicrobiales bacterium]
LLIYRKQYGAPMAVRMLGVFWVVMSAAGLLTEYLFRALGWVPARGTGTVVGDTLRWGPTTILDIVAVLGFAGLYALHRNRGRLGGGVGYAHDPVCGMQVEKAHAPARVVHGGRAWCFCSEHCAQRFRSDPERYVNRRPDRDRGAQV